MLSSPIRIGREELGTTISDPKLEIFVRDLSNLCRKHGIGITGNATLVMMGSVDCELIYQVDGSSIVFLR